MSHVRKQIRDAVKTVLTGLTTTGTNVFSSRIHPFFSDGAELPGLCLYTSTEEVENSEDDLSHIQTRSVLVVVEGYEVATGAIEDTLDTIAAEVETALMADQFLNKLSHGIDLVGTEIEITGEAEKPVGVIVMIYRVYYLTDEGAPEIAL